MLFVVVGRRLLGGEGGVAAGLGVRYHLDGWLSAPGRQMRRSLSIRSDEVAIADAILRLADDVDLHRDLSGPGESRAHRFNLGGLRRQAHTDVPPVAGD